MPILVPISPESIEGAALALQKGDLVALPTETVYGLAGSALNAQAIEKIYSFKGRPKRNPLIIHFSSLEHVKDYFLLSLPEEGLARKFWPGPLSLVLKRPKDKALKIVSACWGEAQALAVRVPSCSLTRKIIERAGVPIAAPSANISNMLSPTRAEHVIASFADQPLAESLLVIDGGRCELGLESTVVELGAQGKLVVLRLGILTAKALAATLQKLNSGSGSLSLAHSQVPAAEVGPRAKAEQAFLGNGKEAVILRAPGQLQKHYSPNTPLRINARTVIPEEGLLAFGKAAGIEGFQLAKVTLNLSPTGDLEEAARNLFAMLWELDRMNLKSIAVAPIPLMGLGLTINERLQKAAHR